MKMLVSFRKKNSKNIFEFFFEKNTFLDFFSQMTKIFRKYIFQIFFNNLERNFVKKMYEEYMV